MPTLGITRSTGVPGKADSTRSSVELGADEGGLTFRVTRAVSCSPSVEQLVRDRVEALGGRLEVSDEGTEMRGRLSRAGASLEAVIESTADALGMSAKHREREPA